MFSKAGTSAKVIVIFLVFFGCLLLTHARFQNAAVAAGSTSTAWYAAASVPVATGSNCILYPKGSKDSTKRLHVNADEDGVVRFLAVRATTPSSVRKLVLACVDAKKHAETYSVDLGDAATFKVRRFDASRTSLRVRPALAGDPSHLTQKELIKSGYGLRPDAAALPDAYQRWLVAAKMQLHMLRTDRTLPLFPMTRQRYFKRPLRLPVKKGRIVQKFSSTITNGAWVGPILTGAFQQNVVPGQTIGYQSAYTTFLVPQLGSGSSTTSASIWIGLDDVFQIIIAVNSTGSTGSFYIHRQDFDPHNGEGTYDTIGTRFTPASGDAIQMRVWYCDSQGNNNLAGGYACSYIVDETQGVAWECDQGTSSDCPSYKLDQPAQLLAAGNLGYWAEFIVENDTSETQGLPLAEQQQWPNLSPIFMTPCLAFTAKPNAQIVSGIVDPLTDPSTQLWVDNFTSTSHMKVTLSGTSTRWGLTKCSAGTKWDGTTGECV